MDHVFHDLHNIKKPSPALFAAVREIAETYTSYDIHTLSTLALGSLGFNARKTGSNPELSDEAVQWMRAGVCVCARAHVRVPHVM